MDSSKIIEALERQQVVKKASIANEFMWTCAGVNKRIMRQCPNDYSKYTGVGGTILFTALMAALSGGYAMFFVFSSWIVATLFGAFWGLLIFNLDRFIINSMKVDDLSNKLTWKKVKLQLPRLVMAVFLGLVISTPLEMKIFSDRIESQLLKDNIEHVNAAKDASEDYKSLQTLQKTYNGLLSERKALNDELLKAQKELKEEAEGSALSGKAGHGTIYKDKEAYVEDCRQALGNWDAANKSQLEQMSSRLNALNSTVSHFEDNVSKLQEDGFVARYEAFSNLRDANGSLRVMSLMITMLFIIIEIIPSFFKLVMPSCMYTELCDQYDELMKKLYRQQSDELRRIIDGEDAAEMVRAEDDKVTRSRLAVHDSSIGRLQGAVEELQRQCESLQAAVRQNDQGISAANGNVQQLNKQVANIVDILQMINNK